MNQAVRDELVAWPLQSAAQADQLFARLQSLAAHHGVALRPPPPHPTTCCGRGCNGCVWEGFFAAAAFWRDDALDALQQDTVLHDGSD